MKKVISKDKIGHFEPWAEKIQSEDWHTLDRNLKDQQNQQFIPVQRNQPDIKQEINNQLEKRKQGAYQEGYDAGFAAGQAKANEIVQSIEQILSRIQNPVSGIEEAEKQKLTEVIVLAAQQVVHQELSANPETIYSIVEQVIEQISGYGDKATLYLHPEDLTMVESFFKDKLEDASADYQFKSDQALNRGDCRVMAADSELNARIYERLMSVAMQMGRNAS